MSTGRLGSTPIPATQATVPSGLGLLFTPWRFDTPLLAAGLVTMAAIVYLRILLHRSRLTTASLSLTALFYAAFVATILLPTTG